MKITQLNLTLTLILTLILTDNERDCISTSERRKRGEGRVGMAGGYGEMGGYLYYCVRLNPNPNPNPHWVGTSITAYDLSGPSVKEHVFEFKVS